MSQRDRYYQNLPSYPYLKQWQDLMISGKISEATAYWRSHRDDLHPDMYVCRKPDCWVSVFYFCLTRAEYADMAKLIFRRGDATLLPDADNYYLLPFVCHSLYLQALTAKIAEHKSVQIDSSLIYHSISHILDSGNLCRLKQLVKLGYLSEDNLRNYVASDDVVLSKLGVMIKYLTYCYNVRRDAELDLTKETSLTIEKFDTTIKFLQSYGAVWTPDATRLCIDYYLYELLSRDRDIDSDSYIDVYEPIYHTQMDATQVAILRPLLNDYRYVETCRAIGCTPDSDVYNYNI